MTSLLKLSTSFQSYWTNTSKLFWFVFPKQGFQIGLDLSLPCEPSQLFHQNWPFYAFIKRSCLAALLHEKYFQNIFRTMKTGCPRTEWFSNLDPCFYLNICLQKEKILNALAKTFCFTLKQEDFRTPLFPTDPRNKDVFKYLHPLKNLFPIDLGYLWRSIVINLGDVMRLINHDAAMRLRAPWVHPWLAARCVLVSRYVQPWPH